MTGSASGGPAPKLTLCLPGAAITVALCDGGSLNTVTLAAPEDRHTVTRGRKGAVRGWWGTGAAQEGARAQGQPDSDQGWAYRLTGDPHGYG